MNFQYFFFNTYPGYFLQVLPFAMIAGAIYGIIRYRKDTLTPIWRKLCSVLFICYITGLVCLVAILDAVSEIWYRMFYHMDGDSLSGFLNGSFNFVPDLHINGERMANLFVFLPFGILYPLAKENALWRKTLLAGFMCSLVIEVLQPVFGRAFDINDIILNTVGVLISATVFFVIKKAFGRKPVD